ncbi:MAG TPA: squalene/phytoene synthase family protein [Wenzhouxiangellaceae bacterium]|nr:squalene/phytoene synthase family protein [Wenzhouxiangellaceae bacterium]
MNHVHKVDGSSRKPELVLSQQSSKQSSQQSVLRSALEFQTRILGGVSRTFALTIPSLPGPLRVPVTNAYLLCRVADTIEDDAGLSVEDKRASGRQFIEVLCGNRSAAAFAETLAPRLASETLAAERDLVARVDQVVEVTRSLGEVQKQALIRCVSLMSDGMHRFQQQVGLRGLDSQQRLDEYCYFVAGVVGEMLTELFCAYSSAIARRRQQLMRLAPSFGQGLQMTNILKDVQADRERGVCWLPRTAFDLSPAGQGDLIGELDEDRLRAGMERLAVVAHGHLQNALSYTLLIPRRHLGIRRFCLWALGMAVPTLDNIYHKPVFESGDEVKISRLDVRGIVRRYGLMASSDSMLRTLFRRASRGLPKSDPAVAKGLHAISRDAAVRAEAGLAGYGEHELHDSVSAK